MASEQGSRKLLGFFAHHPAVGVTGSLASVVGVALAVYFYVAAEARPGLTTFVHPVRATVVKGGQASALAVSFSGIQIKSDISAAQVAIWNAGKAPIRPTDVRRPITISVGAPILEASIRKRSRDVVRVDLDRSGFQKGSVGVTWDILEQGDGAVIQVIYAGNADAPFHTAGAVVGQPSINEVVAGSYATAAEQYSREQKGHKVSGYFILGLGSVWLLLTYALPPRVRIFPLLRRENAILVISLYLIGYGLWLVFHNMKHVPPFDFQ